MHKKNIIMSSDRHKYRKTTNSKNQIGR